MECGNSDGAAVMNLQSRLDFPGNGEIDQHIISGEERCRLIEEVANHVSYISLTKYVKAFSGIRFSFVMVMDEIVTNCRKILIPGENKYIPQIAFYLQFRMVFADNSLFVC